MKSQLPTLKNKVGNSYMSKKFETGFLTGRPQIVRQKKKISDLTFLFLFVIISIEREVKKMDTLRKTMTKKAYAEYRKKQRIINNMNTGTRSHKNPKDYSRAREKAEIRKAEF